MATTDNVLKALKESSQPMKAAELAAALSIDKKEIDKAIKELSKEGLIESPKRCFWAAK